MSRETNRWRVHPRGAVFSHWTAPDGMALRRMDWLPTGRAGRRGSLLFAGGRGDFIEKYLEAYAGWRAEGWAVTAFDWRGQGASRGDIVGGNHRSFDPLIDDFAGLIGEWRTASLGPHVAIGHSMGGHLLLRTIIERRPALDAAVLVAPMIGVNSAPLPFWLAPDIADTMCRIGFSARSMWKTPKAMIRPGAQRQRNLTGSHERYEDEMAWWGREPGFNLGPPSWGWMCAAFRSAEKAFTQQKLGEVDLPILILATERDRLVSVREIRRAAAQLPHAELAMIEGAAHEILRDADPARAAALARIDAFLAAHAP